MTEMDLEQVRLIQLDVLSAVHQFCCENDIRYSLACGTLLGAKRHKGYIPWDDDIDIYLLRDDYNKLLQNFPETYQGLFKIASLDRDERWDRAYAKGYHYGTIFKESTESKYSLGVCIDIFPIDSVPNSDDEWRHYNKLRLFWQKVYFLKSIKLSKTRSTVKNIVLLLGKIVILPISQRAIAKHISRIAQKYNNIESEYVFENVLGIVSRRPFPKRLFDSVADIVFEDRIYKAFSDSEEYLKKTYGNWDVLPPVEKRITHHSFKAYWK